MKFTVTLQARWLDVDPEAPSELDITPTGGVYKMKNGCSGAMLTGRIAPDAAAMLTLRLPVLYGDSTVTDTL